MAATRFTWENSIFPSRHVVRGSGGLGSALGHVCSRSADAVILKWRPPYRANCFVMKSQEYGKNNYVACLTYSFVTLIYSFVERAIETMVVRRDEVLWVSIQVIFRGSPFGVIVSVLSSPALFNGWKYNFNPLNNSHKHWFDAWFESCWIPWWLWRWTLL